MTLEDHFIESQPLFPFRAFKGLDELITRTVHGTKVEQFKPEKDRELFHPFEIHTEEEKNLDHLNMIFFSNPIACYYLIYVEVSSLFRGRRGLGNNILRVFKESVEKKGALGLLDNIIPPDDLTYDIYTNQVNPPLVILRDRRSVYIRWKKVEGIHSEEALDQLRTTSHLKEMNRMVGIDRVMVRIIGEIRD